MGEKNITSQMRAFFLIIFTKKNIKVFGKNHLCFLKGVENITVTLHLKFVFKKLCTFFLS